MESTATIYNPTSLSSGAVPCTPTGQDCGCGCGGTGECGCGCSDPIGLERTRFYPRQLVGPDELTQDQRWIRDKMRRHNRLLHGWGVVCGCDVRQAIDRNGRPIPWTVLVETGDVLGPFGDEIVVPVETTYDLRAASTSSPDCPDPADPWCTDIRIERKPRQTLYLAIRYAEVLTRPVRSTGGCGCDEHSCEYSRIREAFVLSALDELPPPYRVLRLGARENPLAGTVSCSPAFGESVRPCPPCPTDPWVVLADITADADGTLTIDAVEHRRYVASFGAYSFTCGTGLVIEPNRWTNEQRVALRDQLDPSAMKLLQEQHDGALEAITALDAAAVKGVSKRSVLGRFLAGSTIEEVALQPKDDFVAAAVAKGVQSNRAADVWNASRKVIDTVQPGG